MSNVYLIPDTIASTFSQLTHVFFIKESRCHYFHFTNEKSKAQILTPAEGLQIAYLPSTLCQPTITMSLHLLIFWVSALYTWTCRKTMICYILSIGENTSPTSWEQEISKIKCVPNISEIGGNKL
jgi:hypothetical protein